MLACRFQGMIMQEYLHRCDHAAISDQIADKHDTIIAEIFNRSFNRRITPLTDSSQFLLCTTEHPIMIASIRRLRSHFQDTAAEYLLNLLRYTLRAADARTVKYQVSPVTARNGVCWACRIVLISTVRISRLFRLFRKNRTSV